MSNHNPARYWAAAAFGLGLLLFSTPALADKQGQEGGFVLVLVMLSGVLTTVLGIGLLIPVAIWARRGAPPARWKVTMAVVGIVIACLLTLWNLLLTYAMANVPATMYDGRPPDAGEVAFTMAFGLVPLVLSICGLVWSGILFARNFGVEQVPHPPPQHPPYR